MTSCLVVMYHYIRDSAATPFPDIRALPPALFEQQLDWLQREYEVVDPARLEAALVSGGPLPRTSATLTFDDGFVDHYATALPIMKARGVAGVFFISRETIGEAARVLGVHKTHFLLATLGADAFGRAVLDECRHVLAALRPGGAQVFGTDAWEHADERAIKNLLNYDLPFGVADEVLGALFTRHIGDEAAFARTLYLSDAMIAEMARAGMTFGYHTRSHRMLSRLSAAEQEDELRGGVEWIRELTGQASVPFCYPWGGPNTYNAQTLGLLDDCGYSVAYNTVRRRAVIGRDGRFELPRLDTRDLPPYTAGEPSEAAAMASPGERP